mgnify:CR=1 FL=1
MAKALIWFRKDLRLSDNPALAAALRDGYAPVPVYVHAPDEEGDWAPGAASLAWLDRSLRRLHAGLDTLGSGLVVVSGPSKQALERLALAHGAEAVYWNRRYEPAVVARDTAIKSDLRGLGIAARSFNGSLLVEPWQVETGDGGPYRVFTPYWKKAAGHLGHIRVSDAPGSLPSLPEGLDADCVGEPAIDALELGPSPRWDTGFWERFTPGEGGAQDALGAFADDAARSYLDLRDRPDRTGTSRLSPHLHFGEISPRQVAVQLRERVGSPAAERHVQGYVRELGWREFSHHLLHHFPDTVTRNLNPRFEDFPWRDDADGLAAWQRGRTGVPIVDAGMRELWHTGWMHNRVRMIVASFLTKNLRLHWHHGARWFWDTLVDADLANNTQGWQWTAGTGADAAPYFRVFNPVTQATKFDPDGDYIRRWCPELAKLPTKAVHAPWEHDGERRRLAPDWPQAPIIDLADSRRAALAAYDTVKGPR